MKEPSFPERSAAEAPKPLHERDPKPLVIGLTDMFGFVEEHQKELEINPEADEAAARGAFVPAFAARYGDHVLRSVLQDRHPDEPLSAEEEALLRDYGELIAGLEDPETRARLFSHLDLATKNLARLFRRWGLATKDLIREGGGGESPTGCPRGSMSSMTIA